MRAVQVAAVNVRYHLLCAAHGPIGSIPIGRKAAPVPRRCAVCGATSEIWVGTIREMTALSASGASVRLAG
jgi:hypothetical protein